MQSTKVERCQGGNLDHLQNYTYIDFYSPFTPFQLFAIFSDELGAQIGFNTNN
jgi:hypothetical protein